MAKAPGKAFRKGITLKQIMRMFPDNESAEAWFIGAALAPGRPLPVLRRIERPGELPAQDHAVSLPGAGLRSQALQHQDGLGYGRLQDRLSGLDCRCVPGHDQPQGRVEHAAAP